MYITSDKLLGMNSRKVRIKRQERDTGGDELHVTAVQRGGRRGELWQAVARVGQWGKEEAGRPGGMEAGREHVVGKDKGKVFRWKEAGILSVEYGDGR